MITLSPRINEKIEAYVNHCMMGVYFLSENHFEESANKFRMSGEAFMKMIIYHHKGDVDGHEVVMGRSEVDGTPKPMPHTQLSFWELQQITHSDNAWIGNNVDKLLNQIRNIGNENSHDKNTPVSAIILKEDVEKCLKASEQLTCEMFNFIGQSIPDQLTQAYKDGFVAEDIIDEIRQRDLDSFLDSVNGFDKTDRYILISPFKTPNITEQQLSSLKGVSWSVIVDFNIRTKEAGGLYHAMLPDIEGRCVPITIHSKDDPSIISKGINGNVNWIFANGLNTLSGTVAADIKAWYGLRYNQLLKVMLREFCKKSLNRVHVICLLEETDYVEEIVHIFNDIEFAERDLVTFNFISRNEEFRKRILGLSKYGFGINCYSFNVTSFLSMLEDYRSADDIHSILVPARDTNNENTQVDMSDLYGKLMSNGILLVHKTIGEEKNEVIASTPKFYFGETITWRELECGIDVKRAKYKELQDKVIRLLQGRQSQKFNLYHYAGAGGSTISRRLAYDMRTSIPTMIISLYKRGQTFTHIDLVCSRVQRPVLAIVEASMVGSIDELIAECNAKKRIIIFVYVERTLKKPKTYRQEYVELVSDKMRDADEKSLFMYKVQLYNSQSPNLQSLENTPFAQSEVIDFALSIAEQDYKKENLRSYVAHYTEKVSEPMAEFLAYVAMIYHYAQKPVSDVIFRKVFVTKNGKTGLDEYLRSNPDEKDYMHKLLVVETGESSQDRFWRPRFSIFAEVILETLLGGKYPDKWKNCLPEWARKLIRTIKENNEFLVDEVHDILKAVYLERDKEDMLGFEEQWEARGASEKFSQILEDLMIQDEQELVLKKLVEAYPGDSHFWGHLARFCYENASTPREFEVAAGYIEKAFSVSAGGNDYTLLHIAGMCQRRRIEYYNRNSIEIGFDDLKSIVAASKQYFSESRSIYPKNIHAYMSEIQLLVIVIEYGKSLSKYDKYSQFITAPENEWYFDQYQEMNNLMDELHTLVEQTQTLGVTKKIARTSEMLVNSESRVNEYIGNYKEALTIIRNHINSSDRLMKPRLRMMYVRTLLLSKVDGDHKRILDAWGLLSETEQAEVKRYLNQNVEQDSGDVYSMRLWLQAVRYGGVSSSIGEVKSRLKAMYNNAQDYPMARLEAAYYLFVFNAFELIKEKDPGSTQKIKEVGDWLAQCMGLSPNDKHVLEWLKHLNGIDGIVNNQYKPEFESMIRVSGTIVTIKSNMQGEIRLTCGLNAFFTPSIGNFIRGKDETTPVTMNIGFRHDGLIAFRVARINEKPHESHEEEDVKSLVPVIVEDVEIVDDTLEKEGEKVEIYRPEAKRIQEFKVVGKIDLDKLKRK